MAYEKQTWNTNSFVNPTRMNHIENGIQANSDNIDTLTQSASDMSTEVSGIKQNIADLNTTVDDLQSDVADLQSDAEKHSFGTPVDIKGYFGADNQFTVPTNGYVRFTSGGSNTTQLMINGSTLLSGKDFLSIYVIKGMKLYFGTSAPTYANFYPLV